MINWISPLLAVEEGLKRSQPSLQTFLGSNWPLALAMLLGAAGIYLLLPRPRPLPTLLGVAFATAALVLAGILIIRTGNLPLESSLFYLFSAFAIISATLLITQSHPARAALSFTLLVLSNCGLFLLLAAPFLMAASIIIYAGAIVVTFLFVLMLAQQAGLGDADARSREPLFSVVAGFLLLGTLLWVIGHQYGTANIDKELEPLLKLTQLAGAKQTAKEITEAVGPDEKLFRELRGVLSRAGQFDLHDMVFNDVQQNWPENKAGNEDQMRQRLDLMQSIIQQARAQSGIGTSRLSGKDLAPLSNLSGPPGTTPARELRTDPASGLPLMPADNATYLGKSLFTDYLLPVELGGFLLLVAVIGSIAITHRSQEKTV